MRIGFDFDNTIVNYDRLFHKVAVEQDLIPKELAQNKLTVRDYLRAQGKEDAWTALQGYVYGARMAEADAYPEVINVMRNLKSAGCSLAIVSHKTRYPYLGPQYDLHAAAMQWIQTNLQEKNELLIAEENIFFKLTKNEKIQCIANLNFHAFLDDLPEILTAPLFPESTQRYLFDPENTHKIEGIHIVSTWQAFASAIL